MTIEYAVEFRSAATELDPAYRSTSAVGFAAGGSDVASTELCAS